MWSDTVLNREALVKNFSDGLLVLFFLSQRVFFMYFCMHTDPLCKRTSALPEELQLNFPSSSPEEKDASAAETCNVFG